MSAMVFNFLSSVFMAVASFHLGRSVARRRASRQAEQSILAMAEEIKVVRAANAQCERQFGAIRHVLMSEVAYAYRLECWAKGLQDLLTWDLFKTDRTFEIAGRMRDDVQTVLESSPPIVDLMTAIDLQQWQRFEELSGERKTIQ